MFEDTAQLERRKQLEDTVEELHRRFGKYSITYGILLGDFTMPNDGRLIVKMPGIMRVNNQYLRNVIKRYS